MKKEWDEVTGVNPPFNRPHPYVEGSCAHTIQNGHGGLCATCAHILAVEERESGCNCEKCFAYWEMKNAPRRQRRAEHEREKLEHRSEQARVQEEKARAGYGRGRER
jgi:hypothetical protein